MSDVTDPKAWADKAEDDFTAAQLLLRRKEPLTYIVCYHSREEARSALETAKAVRRFARKYLGLAK